MNVSSEEQYRDFIKTPMGDKPVSLLPGTSSVLEQRLNEAGIVQAYQVLGKFLYLEKGHIAFYEWLRGFGADNSELTACFNALNDWCKEYLNRTYHNYPYWDLWLEHLYTIHIEFVMLTELAPSWE